MKRKVKFQEGGAVEEPARRPTPRSRISRMSEAARNRQAEARARVQAEIERLNAMRDVEDFNRRVQRGQVDAETMRRMGGTQMPSGRQDFTTTPEGVTRRGAAAGREVVPFQEPGVPARPSAGRALAEVATPRAMPLGSPRPRVGGNVATMGGALALEAAEPLANYARGYMERRGAEADARREANLQAFRNQEAAAPSDGPAAGSMQNAPRPAPRPAARPAAPAPRPRVREMTADELNEMELRRIRAERQMEEDEARARRREEPRGGSGDIGAASARARGEQVGPPGQYNMKKGGMVPAPKKKMMMKGGIVAKPKAATKTKAKPMPAFKKGGVVKKGKK